MVSIERADGIDIALDEARWATAVVDVENSVVEVGLDLLLVPESGPMPTDTRRFLLLTGVSRVVASYRDGWWNDPDAPILPLGPSDLNQVLKTLGQLPVYGGEFVDRGDEDFSRWEHRLSFDVTCTGDGRHTLDLFQETEPTLDVRIWFGDLQVLDRRGNEIPIAHLVADSNRWWDAMNAGDPRIAGAGIFPLAPDEPPS